MRLYKMELYKICHRKFFALGMVCIIGILFIDFHMLVQLEKTTVNGITYTGYQAVREDRRITEEFKGIMTEEKATQILEKYELTYSTEEDGVLMNNNFLINFLEEYYIEIYSRTDSSPESAVEIAGKEIQLEYYRGWRTFLDVIQVEMTLGSILVLCCVAVVFSGEEQVKMRSLLFTTKEGKRKDIYAKFAAAFTVAAAVWLIIVVSDLVLCGIVYGLDGLVCYNGMVMSHLFPWPERMIPMYAFVAMALLFSLLGFCLLCAITLCLSAGCRSNFHAVVLAAVCYIVPVVVVSMLAGGFYGIFKYMAAAPVFMVLYLTIEKIYDVWQIIAGIAVVVSVYCTISACRKYSRRHLS